VVWSGLDAELELLHTRRQPAAAAALTEASLGVRVMSKW
jgi:hypothetical protein